MRAYKKSMITLRIILGSFFLGAFLMGCAVKQKTLPPEPRLKSIYDLFEEGDWYLPRESALRLGEYILLLQEGYE